jgi:hypothetical protein
MEGKVRKVLLTLAAAPLLLSAAVFTPVRAEAMPLSADVTMQAGSSNLLQQIDCRRIWRCGYWGCGWRDVCWGDRDDHPRWRDHDRDDWRWRRDHDRDDGRWRRDRY